MEQLVGTEYVYSISSATLIHSVILGVVLGICGYLISERFKRTRGVTPWGFPSALWAFLLFLFSFVAVVIYAIACFMTRNKHSRIDMGDGTAGLGPNPPGPYGGANGWGSPPASWRGGAPPQGWDAPGSPYTPPQAPQAWQVPPAPSIYPNQFPNPGTPEEVPPVAHGPERSWLPDPSGRHELRYWDGSRFTEHVADAKQITVDPF
jgi:hypothetical protein